VRVRILQFLIEAGVEWGEAADDVSSITMNYIFYSLQKYGKLAGPLGMYELFFK